MKNINCRKKCYDCRHYESEWCKRCEEFGNWQEKHISGDEKPPLGVIPCYLFLEKRITELLRAMLDRSTYDCGDDIMTDWNNELQRRLKELNSMRVSSNISQN